MNTLLVRTLADWRVWLTVHHASASEVWLIFYKRHRAFLEDHTAFLEDHTAFLEEQTGDASIDYQDALDEALCFGWVDSLVKRLDDARYARKFTPRRPNSRWSQVNRKRYAELEEAGRLKPPGIARRPTKRSSAPAPGRLKLPTKLPTYIQRALKAHPPAARTFKSLSREQRRRYFAWIESAKREETRLKRLAEAICLLTAGKVLGLK